MAQHIGPETRIKVDEGKQLPVAAYDREWLKVDSFNELMQYEKEILERIAYTQNGGNLFMAHPLMLLADIGVALTEKAKEELIRREPSLASLSELPYKALKESADQPRIRFHLHGLFKGETS